MEVTWLKATLRRKTAVTLDRREWSATKFMLSAKPARIEFDSLYDH